ncbi:D-alanyl-D-alanine carboxypeptidase / D-alanyl-D-alanine-endopeptidase (penicillin-binding protein 4) [Pedobacter westerhofensis]|uniref:D-alanyl-D-alanine carboxypeptidase / D-alanyl-D-alanine-endopeptidase (Penicillin-binding protein 4) n=1 Tax=Pedobacter westerhofensis TaxID=425512 RepID=A0A521BXQ3_9SPHI|nr:D-alanyl-D-alanine carboxypeptidase/D-alanyl-D-alanine-endopeptidase [Pedobacter westerhofensis]SMO51351.1 D-alanyl-D-alanine carboxypeptidase / D-alanyl-D-alanine-endopeptidase (penicillin-binding protein 4) [Pedobacter westerhofensis]
MLKRSLLLLFALSSTLSFAQTPAQKLSQSFSTLQEDPQAKYAICSICVLDANTGKEIFAKNENIGVATASTLKTITAATAFSLLGKDFHYHTTLGYSGSIAADGTLNGDVIITGGGDPTLASWRYENKEGVVLSQWVAAIKAAGIKKIEGKIIGDDRLWGTQGTPEGWTWQDMGNYFGAGPSALSWRENQFDIKLRANNTVSVLRAVPAMPYLTIVNELHPGEAGSGDRAYAYLPPLGNIAYLRGSWARDIQKSGISVALPDPAYDAAFRLQDTLQKAGIKVNTAASTARQLLAADQHLPSSIQNLNTITSPSLAEIVFWLNKKSVNLYAEHLLKTLAWKAGKEATTSNGAGVEIRYWANKGLDRNALNIIDGSGLSPATRVTTAAMANILFQSQKEEWFPEFYKSLPENNGMKLKSGTINDVSAFAGYYTADNGNKYVIVININNYSGSGINPKLFRVLNALK